MENNFYTSPVTESTIKQNPNGEYFLDASALDNETLQALPLEIQEAINEVRGQIEGLSNSINNLTTMLSNDKLKLPERVTEDLITFLSNSLDALKSLEQGNFNSIH